jgi:hypothetical protein
MAGLRNTVAEIIDGEPCKKGHGTKRYARFGGCVECVRLANKKRLDNTPREVRKARLQKWVNENREHANAWRVEYARKNPARRLLNSARAFAKKSSIPFNLELSDIVIPERCPIFDIPLERGSGERTWNSPSLDRIIPERGYTKGNIVIVSWRANRIKSDASLRELERLTAFYRSITKD